MTTPVRVIAHYNVIERIDSPCPGDRFRARDTRLGRTVDLRLMPHDFAPTEAERASILEEAREARALSHPNIIATFDAGEHDERIYFVFELPRGGPVRREMVGQGRLAPRRAVDIGIQVADALGEAHARDMMHGALTIDSVLVTEKDQVKLAGLGLPSLRAYDVAGRRGAARPHRSTDGELADIQALGAILYQLVTGVPPTPTGAAGRPVVPRQLNPQSSPDVDDIILRALAPTPTSRYQTVVTMGAELRSVAAMLEVREESHAPASSVNVAKALLLALTMLGLAAAVVWWFSRGA